jgi:uncharacterized damage-inducible protein DinB
MLTGKTAAPFEVIDRLLAAYDTNERINRYLIESLPPAAWRAEPPGGKGRTIASVVAHMQNVRVMWMKSAGPAGVAPSKLEGEDFSPDDVLKALAESCRMIKELLSAAFRSDGRIKGFKPDAASFLAYLIAHDAHHRGQITMLARQTGHPISKSAGFGMWEWGTR